MWTASIQVSTITHFINSTITRELSSFYSVFFLSDERSNPLQHLLSICCGSRGTSVAARRREPLPHSPRTQGRNGGAFPPVGSNLNDDRISRLENLFSELLVDVLPMSAQHTRPRCPSPAPPPVHDCFAAASNDYAWPNSTAIQNERECASCNQHQRD